MEEAKKHNDIITKLLYKIAEKDKEKKPFNINIKNHNPREPKIKEHKRYSSRQKYRMYKTKIEVHRTNIT